jgi:hypothetical protein
MCKKSAGALMPDEADFDAFVKGYALTVDLARLAIKYLGESFDYDGFQREGRQIYERHCVPDNIRPPRPSLRLVANSGD